MSLWRQTSLVLLLCMTLPLNGCLSAAIGGAAVGAGYLGKKEYDNSKRKQRKAVVREERRNFENQLKREKQIMQAKLPSKDSQLAQQINNAMIGGNLTHVMSISTQVQNGNVTLFGTVPSPIIADRAVETASQMPGVRSVTSRLMINERAIKPILDPTGKPVRGPYPHQQRTPAIPAQNNRVNAAPTNQRVIAQPNPYAFGVPQNRAVNHSAGLDATVPRTRMGTSINAAPNNVYQRSITPNRPPAPRIVPRTVTPYAPAPVATGGYKTYDGTKDPVRVIKAPPSNAMIGNANRLEARDSLAPVIPVSPQLRRADGSLPTIIPASQIPTALRNPSMPVQPQLQQQAPRFATPTQAIPQPQPFQQRQATPLVSTGTQPFIAEPEVEMKQMKRPRPQAGSRDHWFPKFVPGGSEQ